MYGLSWDTSLGISSSISVEGSDPGCGFHSRLTKVTERDKNTCNDASTAFYFSLVFSFFNPVAPCRSKYIFW